MQGAELYTLLIADDEPDILSMLVEYFSTAGYRVLAARDGEEAVRMAEEGPDLVLLDVAMPKMDGFGVCRRLRAHLSCPILFLTARIEDADELEGFEAGADDYVLKPFSLPVRAARVSAHLTREGRQSTSAHVRFAGNITVDFDRCAVLVSGRDARLTAKEFEILSLLAKRPGRVFDRDFIHRSTGGWDAGSDPRGVTELIRRIRQKLSAAGADCDPIETVWGMGYRWLS